MKTMCPMPGPTCQVRHQGLRSSCPVPHTKRCHCWCGPIRGRASSSKASRQEVPLEDSLPSTLPPGCGLTGTEAVVAGSSTDDDDCAASSGAVVGLALAPGGWTFWIMFPWTAVGVRRGGCPKTAVEPPGGLVGAVACLIARVKRSF